MSVSSSVGAALIAVALSACAHEMSSSSAPSYAGGRAAQPSGFIAPAQHASYEQAPDATRSGTSYLGGQAGQPSAWLDTETPRVASTSNVTSCNPAGRAAQPFSGPSLHAVKSDATHVACRSDGARSQF